MERLSQQLCFGGSQETHRHISAVNNCDMQFSVFLPVAAQQAPVPALLWLSGLTCNEENFVVKAGAQRVAAELGMAFICPDTSPRGDEAPDDEDAWDFGKGAGFYLNATQSPWNKHYNMYDYLVKELMPLVTEQFSIDPQRLAISGHSMGGHGSITIGLKHPELFKSISAFSPITNPVDCPWGEKAFSNYLGGDRTTWLAYDSCNLIKSCSNLPPLLVDQGLADSFLEEQLKTDRLVAACAAVNYKAQIRMQKGYDHSYFFIASFIEEHLRFHYKNLL